MRESFCDGLGACLGHCPTGALQCDRSGGRSLRWRRRGRTLAADRTGVGDKHMAHLAAHGMDAATPAVIPVKSLPSTRPAAMPACPSVQMRAGSRRKSLGAGVAVDALGVAPVARATAPGLTGRALFPGRRSGPGGRLRALCLSQLSPGFLKGNAVAVGCPKLDDARANVDKVTEILTQSDVRSLKVVYMEVPCCRGLYFVAEPALVRQRQEDSV